MPVTQEPLLSSSCLQQGYHNAPHGAHVKGPYHKDIIPKGDPDCKLGVKRSTNQEKPDGSKEVEKEYVWGYGSAVAAATTPDYGDVVLAEYTQPFNAGDITYFQPLTNKLFWH